MAKAKKSEGTKAETSAAAAKKAPAKAGGKAKAAAPKSGAPVFNTFAAESAARMIGAKAGGGGGASTQAGGEAKKETSAFKQLKQSLAKPHSVGNLLNSTISPAAKKSNAPFQGGRQVGHNQTFGSDASKNFVPRRTGG